MSARQKAILVVLLGAQFMFALDFSILTVALPKIQADIGFSIDSLPWVVTSFALTAAGFMLLFGRIGDLFGRKKLFLFGMLLLVASSLVGGLSATPEIMIIARVAQGLATAIVTPSGMALITTSFPEGPLRNRALRLNGALLSLGFAAGAVLGGVLTTVLSWRWNFFINVPVGVVFLIAAAASIAESRSDRRPKLDVPGAVTVTLGLLSLVITLLLASTETTASALAWTFYLLARHPDIECHLHSEVDHVLAGGAASLSDIPELSHTQGVITEALRLYPPAWFLTRSTTEDTELGGHRIKPHTSIVFSPYAQHRHPSLFANPDRFDPDRWLPGNARALPRGAHLAFGGGGRKCIGDVFGMTEAVLALATIAARWRLGDRAARPRTPILRATLSTGPLPMTLHSRR